MLVPKKNQIYIVYQVKNKPIILMNRPVYKIKFNQLLVELGQTPTNNENSTPISVQLKCKTKQLKVNFNKATTTITI